MKIEGSWYKELKQSEAVGSFWTRGTKVNVGLALFVVSILTLGYVGGSGYLGYSDSDGSTAWTSTDQTFITTSNGNRYNATFAGLQAAIYSLNGTGGEVKVPTCNITFTTTIYIPSGVWLHGTGNSTIFYLANAVNKTMIRNHTTNGNKNIRISDIFINGNGDNQPVWWRANANRYLYAHGIVFKNVDYSKVDNVVFYNTVSSGLIFEKSEHITTTNCYFYKNGNAYENDAHHYNHWWAKGLFYDNCSLGIISECIVDDAYSGGILVETVDSYYRAQTDETYWSHDITISDCVVNDTECGYYTEWSYNIVFSGCTASNCNKNYTYDGGFGFSIGSPTRRILLDGCIATSCGNITGVSASNYINNGRNNTFSNCLSSRSIEDGFVNYGSGNLFIGCRSDNDNDDGFLIDGYNNSLIGCTVYSSGGRGVHYISTINGKNKYGVISSNSFINCVGIAISVRSYNVTVSNNVISTSTTTGISAEGAYGVFSANVLSLIGGDGIIINDENCTFSNNIISQCSGGEGIRFVSAHNNTVSFNRITLCTNGIQEGASCDFNKIFGNNCRGCTTPIDVTGTNTTWFCNAARSYGFNTGAIS